jgi:DNA (cytosine-5)-methyltransferase 3A
MRVAMRNHPQTIQLGDITQLKSEFLPQPISLLMGGSPCQGFSVANTSNDKKKLAFNHPQSKLFFEFIRILDETKPDFVFLENVRMKAEYRDIITDMISEVRGYRVEPVLWDSALVSAQRRLRNYWTDIPGFVIPEDRGILLKDILEDTPIDKELAPYMSGEFDGVSRLDKGIFNFTDKDKAVAQTGGAGHGNKILIDKKPLDLPETKDCSEYNPVKKKNYVQFDKSGKGFNSQQDRYFYRDNKSGTIGTKGHANIEAKQGD